MNRNPADPAIEPPDGARAHVIAAPAPALGIAAAEPRPHAAAASTPAPSLARMVAAAPLEVVRFYLRWMARVRRRDGDAAARARRWARWERRLRPGPAGEVMAKLDHWTYSRVHAKNPRLVSLVLLALPVRGALAAIRAARTAGSARGVRGLAAVREALEIWTLQLRFPIAFAGEPKLFYTHRLFDPARRADAGFIFGTLHQNLIAEALNGATDGVMDKREFARRCAAAELPHIPTIAEIDPDGSTRWPGGGAGLPDQDLFTKPALDANGTGASRWVRLDGGAFRSEAGVSLPADAVMRELRAAARRGPLIVQPRLRNHPDVEALVGDTVATVRFASLLLPGAEWQPVLAIHRSARADSSVDNSAKGGVAAPIDLATGMLGRTAVIGAEGTEFTDRQPRTGAHVPGTRLPCWPETLALVERAHRAFPAHPVIGWDVAITADGPVLVEANIIWNARSLQAAHGVALGRLPYAVRLLEMLERDVSGR